MVILPFGADVLNVCKFQKFKYPRTCEPPIDTKFLYVHLSHSPLGPNTKVLLVICVVVLIYISFISSIFKLLRNFTFTISFSFFVAILQSRLCLIRIGKFIEKFFFVSHLIFRGKILVQAFDPSYPHHFLKVNSCKNHEYFI